MAADQRETDFQLKSNSCQTKGDGHKLPQQTSARLAKTSSEPKKALKKRRLILMRLIRECGRRHWWCSSQRWQKSRENSDASNTDDDDQHVHPGIDVFEYLWNPPQDGLLNEKIHFATRLLLEDRLNHRSNLETRVVDNKDSKSEEEYLATFKQKLRGQSGRRKIKNKQEKSTTTDLGVADCEEN